jgi:hypothetical protein
VATFRRRVSAAEVHAALVATPVATTSAHRQKVPANPDDLSADAAGQRALRARMAAYAMHATHDPRVTTRNAREAFMATFERQVDPDCRLPLPERLRRAEAAKKAYFVGLAIKSAKARGARKRAAGG